MLGREVEGDPKLREEMFLLSRLCVGGPRSTGVRDGKGMPVEAGGLDVALLGVRWHF